ncbi:IclR family transcriptional regulator [Aureimonas sp. SK2]|uniref:IclR family transcriptional regulator n=1 Tax=Aureimonas sp. SK2 TaxID=3015992 RepID=UPI002444BB9B|nr:IclR family transcriptional regulator C-terminal domain-containing protein [Aureimonas sp. SK2]
MSTESSSTTERAAEILIHLGAAGSDGLSLQALSQHLGGAKSAVRRGLIALSKSGFVENAGRYGHYRLGPAIFGLANRPSSTIELVRRYRPALAEVAAVTQQASYLMVRAGFDAICIDMHEGTAFVQTLTGGIGGRVPLGIGPGSISLLTLLDTRLANSTIDHNAARFERYNGADTTKVRQTLERARMLGYSYDIGETFPDAGGVGVPVVASWGKTAAAISIAIPASLLNPKRAAEIATEIRAAISACPSA